jgi:hypothetical protein
MLDESPYDAFAMLGVTIAADDDVMAMDWRKPRLLFELMENDAAPERKAADRMICLTVTMFK